MKNAAIVMVAVLMMGLLLTMGFATAKSINANSAKAKAGQKAVSIDDVEDDLEDGDEFDVKRASSEIDRSIDREARESTFAQVSIGQGWAILTSDGSNTSNTSSNTGNFARIFWVEKTFVNTTEIQTVLGTGVVDFVDVEGGCWRISADGKNFEPKNLSNDFRQDGLLVNFEGTIRKDMAGTCQVGTLVELTSIANASNGTEESVIITKNRTDSTETTKAIGALKIGSDLYRLTLDSQTNDSIVFDVVTEKGKVNGTLELEADVSLAGFTVWSGNLDLDSGKSYDIHVATKNSKLKGTDRAEIDEDNGDEDEEKQPGLQGNLNAAERGQGKKLGLWERIRAFFRGE